MRNTEESGTPAGRKAPTTTTAVALGQALPTLGVRHMFGLIGSGNFEIAAASQAAGIEFIAARHESGALSMADGYARATGDVGVATVHQGPGFTNALTPLVEAAKSRTPLVLLAADTSRGDRLSNFYVDQTTMARAAGSSTLVVETATSVLDDLARAFAQARCNHTTVTVMLPLDIQAAYSPDSSSLPTSLPATAARGNPANAAVTRVADFLVESNRPVILAGRGALLSDARTDLESLAEVTGALLGTTALAKSMFRGNPYDLGVVGVTAGPAVPELMEKADLILAFGASLNYWTTRHGDLLPETARVVQVDRDVSAIGEHHPVDLGVVGDAGTTARAIQKELQLRDHSSAGFRNLDVEQAIARRWNHEPYDDAGTADRIDPRTFTIHLNDLLPGERTVATDSGHFVAWPALYLDVPDPHAFVFAQAYQSVGLGLGSAIGAAIGRPDRLTVAPVGDGGTLMACGELETIARLGLPILVVVYNDAAYGAEVHHFKPTGASAGLASFPDTDFAGLARALGCQGATVRSLEDMQAIARWVTRPDGPLVVDVKVEPSVVVPFLEAAFRSE